MRVITGSARGTKLLTPDGQQTRPTADRVKEAVFDILQFEVADTNVLDLFAGTGQLGIEALSRGAQSAVFVDESDAAIKLVRENLSRTHLTERAEVVRSDYAQFLRTTHRKFDLIFLDPPYAGQTLENSLQFISEIDILSYGGIIITERPLEKQLVVNLDGLSQSKDYRYGKTVVAIFRKIES